MNAKNKGRQLPALLPLQYCSVARAARMLECEEEDIEHWYELMFIDLCFKLNHSDCKTSFCTFEDEISKSIEDPLHRQFEINYLKSSIKPYESVKHGASIYIIPLAEVNINDETKEFEFVTSHGDQIFKISWSWPEEKSPDLVVCRNDLEKLHLSITTGEPLEPKSINSALVSNLSSHINELIRDKPKERLTPGISKAVMALTDLVLKIEGEDPSLINNPYKLYSRINELMLKYKANSNGGFDLGISDNAFRDILSKARSTLASENN